MEGPESAILSIITSICAFYVVPKYTLGWGSEVHPMLSFPLCRKVGRGHFCIFTEVKIRFLGSGAAFNQVPFR